MRNVVRWPRAKLASLLGSVALTTALTFGPVHAVEPRLHADGAAVRSSEPPARVKVPRSAQYLGNKRWILYGYADCDLHLYADKNAEGVVQRLYWIQSEAYIPSRPELTHANDYIKSRNITLGGFDFHLDTWNRKSSDAAPADSDLAAVEQLVAAKGLQLPDEMAFVRLVHLPDKAKRKELMIIYAQRSDAGNDELSDSASDTTVARMKASITVEPLPSQVE